MLIHSASSATYGTTATGSCGKATFTPIKTGPTIFDNHPKLTMATLNTVGKHQRNLGDYTYPQFIIDEKTRTITVNLIDKASGRVICHISSEKLGEIARNYWTTLRVISYK